MLYAMLQSGLQFSATSVKIISWTTLVAVIVVFVIVQAQALPAMIQDGRYNQSFTQIIGYCIFGMNLLASVVMALRTRGQIRQDLWLAVILLSFAIEALLSLQGFARYTVGWYAGRIFMLNGISLLLIVLIHSLILMSQHLQSNNLALNRVALTDALTNLGNRRSFDEKLQIYERLTRRRRLPDRTADDRYRLFQAVQRHLRSSSW